MKIRNIGAFAGNATKGFFGAKADARQQGDYDMKKQSYDQQQKFFDDLGTFMDDYMKQGARTSDVNFDASANPPTPMIANPAAAAGQGMPMPGGDATAAIMQPTPPTPMITDMAKPRRIMPMGLPGDTLYGG